MNKKYQEWEKEFDELDIEYWSEDAGTTYSEPLGLLEEQEKIIKAFIRKTLQEQKEKVVEECKRIVKANMQSKEEAEVAQKIGCDTNCVLDGICNVIDNTFKETI